MHVSQMFPSKYIKAADLAAGPRTLQMSSLAQEAMGDGEKKWVLRFADADQGLVLNSTNAAEISEIYGPENSNWIGKPIQLFATTTMFAGKRVPCVRVRSPSRVQVMDVTEKPRRTPEQSGDLDDLGDNIPF